VHTLSCALHHLGVCSFEHLKTVTDERGRPRVCGHTIETGYHEAAIKLGLLDSNEMWMKVCREAADERMGCRSFRLFFARTLEHGRPPDPQALFDAFLDELCPRRRAINETEPQQRERAYGYIEHIFQREHNTTCTEKGLRGPRNYDEDRVIADLNQEHRAENVADDPDAPRSRTTWQTIYKDNYAK
jgi:hypothetical protein